MDDGRTPLVIYVMAILVIATVMAFAVTAMGSMESQQAEVTETHDEAPAPKITHDSLAPTYTYDGDIIRTYVFTDPDSGVQYLVTDKGGITPRLGKNGHIIGVVDEAVEYDEV